MFSLIDTDHSLANAVSEKNGKSPLHYVAQSGQVSLVNKLINYPNCDMNILTLVAAKNKQISKEVSATINWNLHRIKQERISKPVSREVNETNCILLAYATQAIRGRIGIICRKGHSPTLYRHFVELEEYVFHCIRLETVLKLSELLRIELNLLGNRMKHVNTLDKLYTELITLYTDSISNDTLLHALTTQGANSYAVSLTLINAILMYWDRLESSVSTTYRGVRIGQREIEAYWVGREIAWLSFMSCSERNISQDFIGNCWFQIDNSVQCVWSPKLIGDTEGGHEYLYPCGAQFRVTKVERIGVKVCVDLKLICPIKHESILVTGILYKELKSVMSNVVECVKVQNQKMLAQFDNYKTESEKLFELKREIDTLSDKFVETIKVTKREVLMAAGKLAYNCNECKHTCHAPCGDMERGMCPSAISGNVGSCQVCPGQCHYTSHQRNTFRIETSEVSRDRGE